METVNFQCGHCRQLLAVSKQHLGQQVRCPHCQQVVVAPSAEPAAAPPPPPPAPVADLDAAFRFSAPPPEEHDSIFSAPAETDDLFGQAAPPRVEMPADFRPPAVPPPALPSLELASEPQSPAAEGEDLAYVPPPPSPFGGQEYEAGAAVPHLQTAAETGAAEAPAGGELGGFTLPKRRSPGRGWHIPLFIIPLISYAILATVVAGIFWWRLKQAESRPHPLEIVPDIEGDNPTKKKDLGNLFPKPNTPLPDNLKLTLGQTLRLGEVEVQPLRVERGPIAIKEVGRDKPEIPERDALKLYLRVKNLSPDLPFYPLDNYFTRYWRADNKRKQDSFPTSREPYTQLVIGSQHFYGGPAAWNPQGDSRPHEFVVGQAYDTRLQPGKEMETFVCTDPEDPDVDKALEESRGRKLLWRVQFRRGSVDVKGRRVPATAVIGVEFTDNQIARSKPQG